MLSRGFWKRIMGKNHKVEIIESYKGFHPPIPAKRIVERLLAGIPDTYLIGLQSVVLTNASGLTGKQKRKKTWTRSRKILIQDAGGLYHRKWQNQSAWIEIFVDNLCKDWPRWAGRLPSLQDIFVGEILFHELGHHIHATQSPEHKEREGVAEEWRTELERLYSRQKYRYLRPLARILYPILRPLHLRLKREFEPEKGKGTPR
jgi:hypothetical protein